MKHRFPSARGQHIGAPLSQTNVGGETEDVDLLSKIGLWCAAVLVGWFVILGAYHSVTWFLEFLGGGR